MPWMFDYYGSEYWSLSDEYDTREEAIEAGREYFMEEYDSESRPDRFYVGEKVDAIVPMIDADVIIDYLVENMYEETVEGIDDWLVYTPRSDIKKLEERLQEVFDKWLVETNNVPHFFTIHHIETVSVEGGATNV